MATARFILGIICLIGLIGHRLPDRHLLTSSAQEKVLSIARSQLYVRESGKNNFGMEIRKYLAYTHLPQGNPYCAAFISWVFFKAGYQQPRTAWSPDLFPTAKQVKAPLPADLLGIYSTAKKRVVHCGIVENQQNDWIISIEGNTNPDGSSDGNGNYRKWRHKRTIRYFSRWLGQGSKHED
jgi:hypothetical protein